MNTFQNKSQNNWKKKKAKKKQKRADVGSYSESEPDETLFFSENLNPESSWSVRETPQKEAAEIKKRIWDLSLEEAKQSIGWKSWNGNRITWKKILISVILILDKHGNAIPTALQLTPFISSFTPSFPHSLLKFNYLKIKIIILII